MSISYYRIFNIVLFSTDIAVITLGQKKEKVDGQYQRLLGLFVSSV